MSETTEPQPDISAMPSPPEMPTPTRRDTARLARSLEDLEYELAGIGPRRRALNRALTGKTRASGEWLHRHWLGVINGILGAYVGLAVLTPVGFMLGFDGPASAIFRSYRFVCDELPTHSLFIGGYQMCLCSRCLAIYSTMLITGLTLAFLRKSRRVQAIPWWLWLLAAVPMALDGGTQLFGLRESSLALRLLTGTLFGLATALYALPQLDAAARGEPALARRRARAR